MSKRRGALATALAVALLAAPASLPAAAAEPRWKPAYDEARSYAAARAGRVSFAITGLNGHLYGYRASHRARTASVIKAMLLVAYLRKASVRTRALRDPERRLLGPMIRRSDDAAATEVNRLVGARGIERLVRRAHMREFSYDPAVWGDSTTTPREQARFMRRIREYLPGRHEDYAMHLLRSVVRGQRWGIAEVKPRGWKLYFKGGWGSGIGLVDHQVGLLERGRCRVSLAIFTLDNPGHAYGTTTLRGIANRLLEGMRRIDCRHTGH